VTHLRKMMLEELQRRNYSEATTRYYVRARREIRTALRLLSRSSGPATHPGVSSPTLTRAQSREGRGNLRFRPEDFR